MNTSKHCSIRQQQRAIPNIVLHWLVEFGEENYAPGGVCELYFSKRSIKRMNSELGKPVVSLCSKYFRVRIIASSQGKVITTYWKH